MEVGVVVDRQGRALYWHLPAGRSQAALPDSRALWEVLWERRAELGGFAHSHPGSGPPCPSSVDRSTFSAIEAALGQRLDWWITSEDVLRLYRYDERAGAHVPRGILAEAPCWLSELRQRSRRGEEEESNG
jgi:hypothetical protein